MKRIEEFVEQARKKFESQPFVNDYLNKKLKHKEAVGTYLYNQWVYVCQIEGHCKDAGVLDGIEEICIKENLLEAWKAEWPYDADDISKTWVEPSVMYATQSWCTSIIDVKEDKDLLLAHLYASHSEIMTNQGTSILKDRLTEKFTEAYNRRPDEILNIIKLSWDFKIGMSGDLEAHTEHLEEVLPRISLFKVAAKEISEDRSGLNDMSGGERDETEDQKIRAELMANSVFIGEMNLDEVPEDYQSFVKEDLHQLEQKKKETEKTFEEAPKR